MAGLATTFGSGAMTNSIGEIEDASCIMVIGSNTTEAHPIVGLEVRKAVRKRGARLIVINPREIDLCGIADIWLRPQPGSDVALLNSMANAILQDGLEDASFVAERTEGFEEWRRALEKYTPELAARICEIPKEDILAAARMYATAGGRAGGTSTILYAMGLTQHSHGTDNVKAVANLAMLTGNIGKRSAGVNPLRGQSNVQGACDMGALPDVFTGYQKVANAEARERFESAWCCSLPEEPGLMVPDIVDAIYAGQVSALYVLGENPAVSDADVNNLRRALGLLDFVVVQDVFLTETGKLADVVLPGCTFAEKDGTFTNTERRVQRVRKAIEPVGECKPDWQVICEVARRTAAKLGAGRAHLADGFCYSNPSSIMVEIAGVTPSYAGVRYEMLDDGGLQWPVPALGHPGTPVLHVGSFARGKGFFAPVEYLPSAELPDDEYPLVLTTGRSLYHYHTGTLTRRVAGLAAILDREYLQIHPEDASRLGLSDGDIVEVRSRRGVVLATARVTTSVPFGVVFMDFHFSESPTNVLTSPALDPIAKIPELKVCAVKVERAA